MLLTCSQEAKFTLVLEYVIGVELLFSLKPLVGNSSDNRLLP